MRNVRVTAPLSAGNIFAAPFSVPPCPLCLDGAKPSVRTTGREKNAELSQRILESVLDTCRLFKRFPCKNADSCRGFLTLSRNQNSILIGSRSLRLGDFVFRQFIETLPTITAHPLATCPYVTLTTSPRTVSRNSLAPFTSVARKCFLLIANFLSEDVS